MKRTAAPFAFCRRLLLGDDWRLTSGSLLAIALTAELRHHGVGVWWLLPIVVALLLAASVRPTRNGEHHARH